MHTMQRDMKAAYNRAYHAANREAILARKRAYRAVHREEIAAYDRVHNETHRAENAAYMRAYRKKNPGKEAAAQRAWRESNPEKIAAYNETHRDELAARQRAYHAANRERYVEHCALRRARKAGAPRVEKIDRSYIYERDGGICHICRKKAPRRGFHLDHLVPLSKGGAHTHDNLAVAHANCNLRRHDGLLPAQLRLVG